MRDYIAEQWQNILTANGLQSFEDWWQRDDDWFEPPNKRRGGWSGVCRLVFKEDGEERAVFLKRQENHILRTFSHPFRGIATFSHEMENILALKKAGVPVLTPVYFAQRNQAGELRAILVTEALEGFVELSSIVPGQLSFAARNELIKEVARVIRLLHKNKFVHNCLFPKHVFVMGSKDGFEARLIDLEKARKRWRRSSAMFRDLDTLNRHSYAWTVSDRRRFLKYYLGAEEQNSWRQLWLKLAKRNQQRSDRKKQDYL